MSISDLNPTTPADTDFIGAAAEELRQIKTAVNEAFPAVAGAIGNASGVGSNPPTQDDYSNLFTRLESVEQSIVSLTAAGLPAGVIIIWSGAIADIPAGWVLCNGLNGTPDLTDRFVIGAGDTFPVGQNAGSLTTAPGGSSATVSVSVQDHTLTEANIPLHDHHIAFPTEANNPEAGSNAVGPNDYAAVQATQNSRSANYALSTQDGGSNNEASVGLTSGYGAQTPVALTHNASASITDHTHDATPPYYALAYIQKTA
ncbi:MAG: hypothetical protein AAGI72_24660 [Pseudomonadota bacterium]